MGRCAAEIRAAPPDFLTDPAPQQQLTSLMPVHFGFRSSCLVWCVWDMIPT